MTSTAIELSSAKVGKSEGQAAGEAVNESPDER